MSNTGDVERVFRCEKCGNKAITVIYTTQVTCPADPLLRKWIELAEQAGTTTDTTEPDEYLACECVRCNYKWREGVSG